MYNPIVIANFFIKKGIESGIPVTPMKLQKLVYYAYGWYMAFFNGKKLFSEQIKNWNYGPVIESIYREFRHYGRQPITATCDRIQSFDINIGGLIEITKKDKQFLNMIWNTYSRYTAFDLSSSTHIQGSPWADATKQGKVFIPDEYINEYFSNQLNKLKKESNQAEKV